MVTCAGNESVSIVSPRPTVATSAVHDGPTERGQQSVSGALEPAATLVVLDHSVLAELERKGYAANDLLFRSENHSAASMYSESERYRSLARELTRSIDDGFAMHYRSASNRFPDELLRDRDSSFTLIGVVNRLDRMLGKSDTCGEVRFVYQLYRSGRPLPLTMAASFAQPLDRGGCDATARRWLGHQLSTMADTLTNADGPLDRRLLLDRHLNLEVNVVARETNTAATGALMMAFRLDERLARFETIRLENTPDGPWIHKGQNYRVALREWLRRESTLQSIDAGAPELPFAISSRWADSIGLGDALPNSGTFGGIAKTLADQYPNLWYPDADRLAAYDTIATRTGLFVRAQLNTCAGCHEGRSIAGFHLVRLGLLKGDETATMSPHLAAELRWRETFVVAVAQGQRPPDRRRVPHLTAGRGSACALDDVQLPWLRCPDSLRCDSTGAASIGTCTTPDGPHPGDPCQPQEGMQDCVAPSPIYPGGLWAPPCEPDTDRYRCVRLPSSDAHEACRAQPDYWECLRADRNVMMRIMPSCTLSEGCRDGYVCVESADDGRPTCFPAKAARATRLLGHD